MSIAHLSKRPKELPMKNIRTRQDKKWARNRIRKYAGKKIERALWLSLGHLPPSFISLLPPLCQPLFASFSLVLPFLYTIGVYIGLDALRCN